VLNTQNWLSLIEFSAHYRVSLSTLRRRIKAGELDYKLIEGKYLIKNEPLPGQVPFSSQAGSEAIAPPPSVSSQNQASTSPPAPNAPATVPAEEYWTATQALLADMKKAFAHALATKDDQLNQLKGQVNDLKMLVKMLEDENSRMKIKPMVSFDLGLDV
jgi:hypothetical protein